MSVHLTRDDFARPPITLLTISFAGRQYRFSSYPVTILADDGTAYHYPGGLPTLTLERSWNLSSDSPSRTSIPFEDLYFTDDIAELVAQHHDLSNATGEVALWRPGRTWEGRRVWVVGDVVNPIYGKKGEPVSLTIERQPYNDRGLTHDTVARVTDLTFPAAPDSSKEQWYPIPIGYPGREDDGTITRGSPGLVVLRNPLAPTDVKTLLIADGEIEASNVRVFDDSGSDNMAVTTTTDGLGRTVSVVDMTSYSRDKTLDQYWIGFSRSDGGGIYNEKRTGAMEGLGDVLIYALNRVTVPVDRAAWESIRNRLNSMITVGGYIEEAAVPWDWMSEHFLPLVPLDVQAGPDGLYPILWMPAREEDAVKHLVANAEGGVERLSRVEYTRTKDKLVNGYIVNYAIRGDTTDPRRTLTIVPEPDTAAGEVSSGIATRSRFRYDVTSISTLESRWIWTASSAGSWAKWQLRDTATIPRKGTYRAPLTDGWLLRAGQVVTITDTDLHFNRQVALITEAVLERTGIRLTLGIRTELTRDRGQR